MRMAEQSDALIDALLEGATPEDSALRLATLVNRAAARLHAHTRSEAAARKEQPDWPMWAQLQNASRSLILQASTCRDLATRLAGQRQ
jgi:hypothetical protein